MPTTGYSGTPLPKKLGIKPGFELCVVNAPPHYFKLVAPLPDAVRITQTPAKTSDLVHLFETKKSALAQALRALSRVLKPAGIVWVSWPKKSSGVPSKISESTIREIALPLGLVDVKVCAVDQIWSGLKLVWRLENRKGR